MDILGHPIVPGNIIDIYFEHFQTLPWNKFVPTLDILLSLLKCVRNNRKNVSFVIFVMTQVTNYFLAFYNIFAREVVWSQDTTTCCFLISHHTLSNFLIPELNDSEIGALLTYEFMILIDYWI